VPVFEVLLYRDANRGAAAPDADDKLRMKSILINHMRKPERVLEQLLSGYKYLIHDHSPARKQATILSQARNHNHPPSTVDKVRRGVDMGNSLRDVRNRDVAPEPTWMYSRRSRKEFPMAAPRSDLSKSCGYAESS
jgi:hypothetical protein